jgi:predicted RNase H-like nuclease (RuvC/YqgF family)
MKNMGIFRHFHASGRGFLITVLALGFSSVSGQVRIANLEADVQQLRTHLGRLQIEVENLRREVEALRAGANSGVVTMADVNAAIEALRSDIEASDRQKRAEILERVGEQLSRLAEQTRKAMQALAKTVEASPQVMQEIQFSDDYPREGFPYTVQRGDTLSGIASRFKARILDIQNANRIADPTRIQPGQVLFIPVKPENAEGN